VDVGSIEQADDLFDHRECAMFFTLAPDAEV